MTAQGITMSLSMVLNRLKDQIEHPLTAQVLTILEDFAAGSKAEVLDMINSTLVPRASSIIKEVIQKLKNPDF